MKENIIKPSTGADKPARCIVKRTFYPLFAYQRYGVRYGKVAWLSPAAVETKEGAQFKAHVEISDADMLAQGQSRPLRAGMSGKAEIVIGSRSLIEYVFEPLRQLKENSSDVPDEVAKR